MYKKTFAAVKLNVSLSVNWHNNPIHLGLLKKLVFETKHVNVLDPDMSVEK